MQELLINSLSIIIPAYNSGAYIENCIDSIVVPDGASVQILVIDDGSTDNTPEILKRISNDNVRLKVIEKPNGGVSSARNVGILNASGQYVMFLDSDDSLHHGSLDRIFGKKFNGSSDAIVLRGCSAEYELDPWYDKFEEGVIYSGEELMRSGYVRGSSCACLYNLDFLKKHSILFREDLTMGEDTVFFACVLSCGAKISFADLLVYDINLRPDSLSRNLDQSIIQRYGMTITAIRSVVRDRVVADNTLMSVILGCINVAARMGLGPGETKKICNIETILPLSTSVFAGRKWRPWLLNHSFIALFYFKKLKDSIGRNKAVKLSH